MTKTHTKNKDKCNNCGSTETKTFWDYEDKTMLCDECHKKIGDKWQKEVEQKNKSFHNKAPSNNSKIKNVNEKLGWRWIFIILGFINIISIPFWIVVLFMKVEENDIFSGRIQKTAYYMGYVTIAFFVIGFMSAI